MSYGETWLACERQRQDAYRPGLKVNSKTEKSINIEIKKLQDQRSELYANDNITDEELKILEKGINDKINRLMDSKYYTKEEWKKLKGLR